MDLQQPPQRPRHLPDGEPAEPARQQGARAVGARRQQPDGGPVLLGPVVAELLAELREAWERR